MTTLLRKAEAFKVELHSNLYLNFADDVLGTWLKRLFENLEVPSASSRPANGPDPVDELGQEAERSVSERQLSHHLSAPELLG